LPLALSVWRFNCGIRDKDDAYRDTLSGRILGRAAHFFAKMIIDLAKMRKEGCSVFGFFDLSYYFAI
jgi:hypothetical protein